MLGFTKGQGPLGRSFPHFWRDRNGALGENLGWVQKKYRLLRYFFSQRLDHGAPGGTQRIGAVGERTSKGAAVVFAPRAETEVSGLCEDARKT